METLKQLGILPQEVKSIDELAYSAELLSAIDVREPRNNLSVWKISLETSQVNADKSRRILDAYVDAQLFDYDISPDLSLNIEPQIYYDLQQQKSAELKLAIQF